MQTSTREHTGKRRIQAVRQKVRGRPRKHLASNFNSFYMLHRMHLKITSCKNNVLYTIHKGTKSKDANLSGTNISLAFSDET